MDRIDCVVIGAGVVGLAVARALARQGRETLIVEAESAFGTVTSARNSEVIHAGLYYLKGSLKARLCVQGRDALYAFCANHGVAHRRCGKLMVATDAAQIPQLAALAHAAAANSVTDVRQMSAAEARAMEPALACVAALYSPSTGLIDSHGYMLALQGDAEQHGAVLACHSRVTGLALQADGVAVSINGEATPTLCARWVVNSAGLQAPALAGLMAGFPAAHIPQARYAKGHYFSLAGRAPFSRLVYPVPEPGGLGTHLVLDLGGQARFGPDVEWVADDSDYTVPPERAATFYNAIRRYWPGLPDGALQPDFAGIRPKISGPGEPAQDFRIDGPARHGMPGVVNLFGIESPGLTASLAIADEVARIVTRVADARSPS
ncbi:MAG: NAD(P)/FAD-dependent oxidoreductase [Burkholderiales bacterium]